MVDLEALRELAWSGIPAELRPACWQLLLGYLPPNRERRCAGLGIQGFRVQGAPACRRSAACFGTCGRRAGSCCWASCRPTASAGAPGLAVRVLGFRGHLRPACWQLLLGHLPPNRERRCARRPPHACVAQPELAPVASVVAAAAGLHAAQCERRCGGLPPHTGASQERDAMAAT